MKSIYTDIITIGDEILYGQILDSNSQWISAELDKRGIRTRRKTAIGDNEEEILSVLKEAEERSDLIIITGGLGPTSDDLTKPCLVKYFNTTLAMNEEALQDVTLFFEKKGKPLTELNKGQAMLPANCRMIHNYAGTAPGMWFEERNKIFISMPGVPFEMKEMMKNFILPKLAGRFNTSIIYHKIIKTSGIGESFLADKINDWEKQLPSGIRLAYLPSPGEVKLRLTTTATKKQEAEGAIRIELEKLVKIIPEYIYGYDEDALEKVIGELLKEKKFTIATAESCTGGYLAQTLTSIPGSSAYFWGSVVAYQNEVKQHILNVKEETLKKYGAVSEQTVKEMAEGIREIMKTSIGVSTSGVAGPAGGTPEKPVGTVWIGYSDSKRTIARKLSLGDNREMNIRLTGIAVFNLVREMLV